MNKVVKTMSVNLKENLIIREGGVSFKFSKCLLVNLIGGSL